MPRAQIIADLNMDMYLPIFPLHLLEVQNLGESTLGNDARAAAQLHDIEVLLDKQPIDREGAVLFDRMVLTLVLHVANAPSRPTWYPESFFSTIPLS